MSTPIDPLDSNPRVAGTPVKISGGASARVRAILDAATPQLPGALPAPLPVGALPVSPPTAKPAPPTTAPGVMAAADRAQRLMQEWIDAARQARAPARPVAPTASIGDAVWRAAEAMPAPPPPLTGDQLIEDHIIRHGALSGQLPPEALQQTHDAEARAKLRAKRQEALDAYGWHPPYAETVAGFSAASPGMMVEAPGTFAVGGAPVGTLPTGPTGPTGRVEPADPRPAIDVTTEEITQNIEEQRRQVLREQLARVATDQESRPLAPALQTSISDPEAASRAQVARQIKLVQAVLSGEGVARDDVEETANAILQWQNRDARIKAKFNLPPELDILPPTGGWSGKAPGVDIGAIRAELVRTIKARERRRGNPIVPEDITREVQETIHQEIATVGGTLYGVPTYDITREDVTARGVQAVHQWKRRAGEWLLGEREANAEGDLVPRAEPSGIVGAAQSLGLSPETARDIGRGIVSRLFYPPEVAAFVAAHSTPITSIRDIGTLGARELTGESKLSAIFRVVTPTDPLVISRATGVELSDPDFLQYIRRGGSLVDVIPDLGDWALREYPAEHALRDVVGSNGPLNALISTYFHPAMSAVEFLTESVALGGRVIGRGIGDATLSGINPQTRLYDQREQYAETTNVALGVPTTLAAVFFVPDAFTVTFAAMGKGYRAGLTLHAAKLRAAGKPVTPLEKELHFADQLISALPDDASNDAVHTTIDKLAKNPATGVIFTRFYAAYRAKQVGDLTGRRPTVWAETGAAVKAAVRQTVQSATDRAADATTRLGELDAKLQDALLDAWRTTENPQAPRPMMEDVLQVTAPAGDIKLSGVERELFEDTVMRADDTLALTFMNGARQDLARKLGLDLTDMTPQELARAFQDMPQAPVVKPSQAMTPDEIQEYRRALSRGGKDAELAPEALQVLARKNGWLGSAKELRIAARAKVARAMGLTVGATRAERLRDLVQDLRALPALEDETVFSTDFLARLLTVSKIPYDELPSLMQDVLRQSAVAKVLRAGRRTIRSAKDYVTDAELTAQIQQQMIRTRAQRRAAKALALAEARGIAARDTVRTTLEQGLDPTGILPSEPAQAILQKAIPTVSKDVDAATADILERALTDMSRGSLGETVSSTLAAQPKGAGEAAQELLTTMSDIAVLEDALATIRQQQVWWQKSGVARDPSDLPGQYRTALQEFEQFSALAQEGLDVLAAQVLPAMDDAARSVFDDALATLALGNPLNPTEVITAGRAAIDSVVEAEQAAKTAVITTRVSEDALFRASLASQLQDAVPAIQGRIETLTAEVTTAEQTLASVIEALASVSTARKTIQESTEAQRKTVRLLRAQRDALQRAANGLATVTDVTAQKALAKLRAPGSDPFLRDLAQALAEAKDAAEAAIVVARKDLDDFAQAARARRRAYAISTRAFREQVDAVQAARRDAQSRFLLADRLDRTWTANKYAATAEALQDRITALRKSIQDVRRTRAGAVRQVASLGLRRLAALRTLRRAQDVAVLDQGGKQLLARVLAEMKQELPAVTALASRPLGLRDPMLTALSGGVLNFDKLREGVMNIGAPEWTIRQFLQTRLPGSMLQQVFEGTAVTEVPLDAIAKAALEREIDELGEFVQLAAATDPRRALATGALLASRDPFLATRAQVGAIDPNANVLTRLGQTVGPWIRTLRHWFGLRFYDQAELANFGQFRQRYYDAIRGSLAEHETMLDDVSNIRLTYKEDFLGKTLEYLTGTTPIETKVGGTWRFFTAPGANATLGNQHASSIWRRCVQFILNNPEQAKDLSILDTMARAYIPDDYWATVPQTALQGLTADTYAILKTQPDIELPAFLTALEEAIDLRFDKVTKRPVRAAGFFVTAITQAAALDGLLMDVQRIQRGILTAQDVADMNRLVALKITARKAPAIPERRLKKLLDKVLSRDRVRQTLANGGIPPPDPVVAAATTEEALDVPEAMTRADNAVQQMEDFYGGLIAMNAIGKAITSGKFSGFDMGLGVRTVDQLIEMVGLQAMSDDDVVLPQHVLREATVNLTSITKEGGQYATAPLPSLLDAIPGLGGNLRELQRFLKMGLLHGIFIRNQRYFGAQWYSDIASIGATVGAKTAVQVGFDSGATQIPLIGPALQKAIALVGSGKKIPTLSLGLASPTLARILSGEIFHVTLGTRTYLSTDLVQMMREGGVFETSVSTELITAAGRAAEDVYNVTARDTSSAFARTRLRMCDWTEGISLMAHESQRRTRALLFLELLREGKNPRDASKLVRKALFDWKHGLIRSELTTLPAKLSFFWRYHRLKMSWVANALAEVYTDPEISKAIAGDYTMSRSIRQTRALDLLPRAMLAYNTGADEDLEEYELWLRTYHPEWMDGRYAMTIPLDDAKRRLLQDRGYGVKSVVSWALPATTAMDAMQLTLASMAVISSAPGALLGNRGERTKFVLALQEATSNVLTHPLTDMIMQVDAYNRDWALTPAEVEMFSQIPVIKDVIVRDEDGTAKIPGSTYALWRLLGKQILFTGPADAADAWMWRTQDPIIRRVMETTFHVSGLGRGYYQDAEAALVRKQRMIEAGLRLDIEAVRAQARGGPER